MLWDVEWSRRLRIGSYYLYVWRSISRTTDVLYAQGRRKVRYVTRIAVPRKSKWHQNRIAKMERTTEFNEAIQAESQGESRLMMRKERAGKFDVTSRCDVPFSLTGGLRNGRTHHIGWDAVVPRSGS